MGNLLGWDLHFDRTRCRVHDKWAYPTRRAARRVMRTVHYAEPGVNTYRCDAGHGFHIGHRWAT